MGARGCGGQGCRPGLPRSGDRPRRRPCRPEALPFPTTRSASSNPFTGSEKVTAIENAPVTGSLAELVMVTVGAAVFAVMENWSAAALEFPELSCAAPAAMSTVTVPETSGVIVAVCKVAGFTAGRGEPRHRATGIVGQLPRVRGQTPGLPRRGVRRRRRRCGCRARTARRFDVADGHGEPGGRQSATVLATWGYGQRCDRPRRSCRPSFPVAFEHRLTHRAPGEACVTRRAMPAQGPAHGPGSPTRNTRAAARAVSRRAKTAAARPAPVPAIAA